jgi:hypothetical protein
MPQYKAVRTIHKAVKPGRNATQTEPAVEPEIEIIEAGKTVDLSAEDAEVLLKIGAIVEGDKTAVSQPSQDIHTTGFDPANSTDPEGAEATAFSTPERMDSDEPKASQKRATAKQKSSKDDDVSDLV